MLQCGCSDWQLVCWRLWDELTVKVVRKDNMRRLSGRELGLQDLAWTEWPARNPSSISAVKNSYLRLSALSARWETYDGIFRLMWIMWVLSRHSDLLALFWVIWICAIARILAVDRTLQATAAIRSVRDMSIFKILDLLKSSGWHQLRCRIWPLLVLYTV